MGESELKKALRREGEDRAREFWQAAEAAVTARRQEVERQRAELHEEMDRKLQADASAMQSNLLFTAQTNSRKSRLHAEAALEKRLWDLGQKILAELAAADRDRLWQAACAELPDFNWATLVVHPDDRARATDSFPGATVDCDAAIGGGMIAASADGKIRVDNSLICRLGRAWPDLLPRLVDTLRNQVEES